MRTKPHSACIFVLESQLTVPLGGIAKGSVFGFGPSSTLPLSSSWVVESGSLALSTAGDSVIVYCQPTESTYIFLAAITFAGAWTSTSTDSSNSAIPPGLETTNTELNHLDNYQYQGPTSGTKEALVASIGLSSSWLGSNEVPSYSYSDFTVTDDDSTTSAAKTTTKTPFMLGSWLAAFIFIYWYLL